MLRLAVLWITLACRAEAPPAPVAPASEHTPSPIAIRNLQHQITQTAVQAKLAPGDWMRRGALVELLLMEAEVLGRTSSFDRAVAVVDEDHPEKSAEGLLVRARIRAALHRFREAARDLDAAEKAGAPKDRIDAARWALFVATGSAAIALPLREAEATKNPTYGALAGLAAAYEAVGRFEDADAAYAQALAKYRHHSPFAAAWIALARGVMWSERAGDRARGRKHLEASVAIVPEYVPANVHLAELERDAGEIDRAVGRLERIAKTSEDPEPLAILGAIEKAAGRPDGAKHLEEARARYEVLLVKHPPAFADHAAELYAAIDPRRAHTLAMQSLSERETERTLALAIRTARAAGADPCPLVARARAKPRSGIELAGLLDGCH
jgi:tetratricopeptide (TPR) repeat protein